MTRQEQVAQQTSIRRTSANNGLPYRQQQLYEPGTEEYEEIWPPPVPRSAIRYNQPVVPGVYTNRDRRVQVHAPISQGQLPKRRSPPPALSTPVYEDEVEPRPERKRKRHGLLFTGIGMLLMLGMWYGGVMLVNWWTIHQDDATYGRPRTYQFDAVVGHNDSPTNPTHFMIINLQRHVEVIEQPGGDASHAHISIAATLYTDGGDLTPVTGKAVDVNGDGKPDLILSIQAQKVVLLNDGKQFVPLQQNQQNTVHLPPN